MAPQGFFNLRDLYLVISTENKALDWCRDRGLIPRELECPLCGDLLPVRGGGGRRFGRFQCQKSVAGHEVYGHFDMSAANNTFFSKIKLPLSRALTLIYAFCRKFNYELTKTEVVRQNAPDISDKTISEWFSYLREVCRGALDRRYSNQPLIGGPDHTVEIDECKIGHNTFQQGHLVEGQWFLGMVDRDTKEVRLEICPDNKRDAQTLLLLIRKHVAPGTEIIIDCWKGYDGLNQKNFQQMIANHNLVFVDPMTGTTTNAIEGHWRSLRERLLRGGIRHDTMSLHLCEYLWRRDCERLNVDCFSRMLEDIRLLYPGGSD